jgi:hypothetical protein
MEAHQPSSQLIESRFVSYWETTKNSSSPTFTTSLRGRKEFTNPYILESVVEKLKIDEFGSNFVSNSERRHTPDEYIAQDFYLVLRDLEVASASAAAVLQGGQSVSSLSVEATSIDKGHTAKSNADREKISFAPDQVDSIISLPQHRMDEDESRIDERIQKRSRWQ